MPSKKKKYNARFPAGRIKKIMQSDEEVGKVAQAVPIIISRTLELFVESLLAKTLKVTNSRNAKTLSPSHMKQCIMSESQFDFLRELVKNIPDISVSEEIGNDNSPGTPTEQEQPYDLSKPSTSCELNFSSANGNHHNGSQISGTSTSSSVANNSQSPATLSNECRAELKRQWNNVSRIRKQIGKTTSHSSATNSVIISSNSTDCTPSKFSRTDSAPTFNPTIQAKADKDSIRRLQHQPKSVPCTSKEASKQESVPAPIFSIDFCNRPIIKIDYSNLALHDKNSDQKKAAGSDESSCQLSTYTNPVININVSNISDMPSSSNQCVEKSIAKTTTSIRSSLELDEDYDNI